ncbi:stalk domain-containing protein [Aneurinibacillus tyrosinisolvens]|uniref:stalk domain-containing protein n=1 Tax=Aneurinibacillus tyrosinisolvens TaxID=1443435 RepID=UPI00063F1130|nr:hypothetical protein [Aneurinibacillus tyrosinisolvens]
MFISSKLSKKIIIGTVVGTLALSGTAFGAVKAYDKYIKARFASIGLVVNGKLIQTKAEPFIYNGNVYAPVATVANGLGVSQRWSNTDWVNNYKPSVRFDGYNVKDLNQSIQRDLSWKGGGKTEPYQVNHLPIAGQVYLSDLFWIESNMLQLTDYSTSSPKTINIPQSKPEQGNYQYLVPGSVEQMDTNPNNLRFMVYESTSMWKDNKGAWDIAVRIVEYRDGKLTMGNPLPIDKDPYAYVGAIAKTGNILFVQYYDSNSSNHKLIGTETYTMENGKVMKLEAAVK